MSKKMVILFAFLAMLAGGAVLGWFVKQNNAPAVPQENSLAPQDTSQNLVEIFYLPHPPAEAVVEKVDKILAKFPQYKVKKYNFYDKANQQKIESYNLLGHIPVAIFINRKNTFYIDGRKVVFKNFPQSDDFVPTYSGLWDYGDLEKILANPNNYQDDKNSH